jgi:hypothetical protein
MRCRKSELEIAGVVRFVEAAEKLGKYRIDKGFWSIATRGGLVYA